MGSFTGNGKVLLWQEKRQSLWLRAWGKNGIRVQSNLSGAPLDLPQALLERPADEQLEVQIAVEEGAATLRNGLIEARITLEGELAFRNTRTGKILLEEPYRGWFAAPQPNRSFTPRDGGLYRIESRFKAWDGERLWGLGQRQHGRLDQKGCVVELQQRNTEVTIPFLVSNRGYGFLWNNPGIGRVELGYNATRWVADGSRQLDYYVTCGASYADILEQYAGVTGKPLRFPGWASGFWQSKTRYRSQEELLGVAREYRRRGLPLSVITADFFHWTAMGDWKFDPACWPDPAAMVRELEEMGVKLMVSVWPTVSPASGNYEAMRSKGLLINNEHDGDAQRLIVDDPNEDPPYFAYVDATNPEALRFLWDRIRSNYCSHGIRLFWLDCDEPDIETWRRENLRFFLGNGVEVGNLYPLLYQQAFHAGLKDLGEAEILTLSRSAWAGSQRYGALVWSGDIASTFESLQLQVRAGLNMAMSGIPWWNSDVGGFHSGDIRSGEFRELMVRWFQYGVFCPVLRLHGCREPGYDPLERSGASNELWSFGEDVYEILRRLLRLRERLRPYLHEQMDVASERGLPPMRPLFVDFAEDATCEAIDDQFMFGPEILVAPVLNEGARERRVYLPSGTDWLNAWDGTRYSGGTWVDIPAPLHTIPVMLRAGSRLGELFQRLS